MPRREGEAWVVSGRLAYEKLVRVFDERREALRSAGLGERDFLPFHLQRAVQKKLRSEWEGSDFGEHGVEAEHASPCVSAGQTAEAIGQDVA